MSANRFLRNATVHSSTNSATARTELVNRKSSQPSTPVSVGLSGLQKFRGVSGRIVTTNRAERRASDALYRKRDGETTIIQHALANGVLSEPLKSSTQPRVLKQAYADLVRNEQQQSIDVLIEGPAHGRWSTIATVLNEWAELDEGWDGEEADPIAQYVLDAARSFIEVAERYNVSEPRPFIGSDGEVGFIWDSERKASVSFSNADRFLAFCPRTDMPDFRLAGPLNVAVCSPSLFESLREHTAA